MWYLVAILVLCPSIGTADSVVMTRTVRAQSVLTEADLTLVASDIPGAIRDPLLAVGQEARITLYAGRPLHNIDFGPAATVDRNQIVTLAYQVGALDILTEGRALERGGIGDVIRVMNVASRTTILGQIDISGQVRVSNTPQGMNQ